MQTKMREVIKLISNVNNERLCSDSLSDQNDDWNSNLFKNKQTCVLIASFSINEVAMLGWFTVSYIECESLC